MKNKLKEKLGQEEGFSLVELMVAIAISALLVALAAPPFMQWREGLQYREVSNGFVAALRTARSKAIKTNRQVELEVSGNSYRIKDGNRAVASIGWVETDLVTMPPGTGMVATNSRAIANPNGTLFFTSVSDDISVFSSAATTMTISVQNTSVTPVVNRYSINLSQSGRISSTRIN